MGIALLAITLIISMILVRVGALALELTGMSPEMARFQALSAFTGTGFTTRAAEEVVRHPQRRSIITALIVIGWAGVAFVITGLLQTFRVETFDWMILLRLIAVLLALFVLYRIVVLPRLSQWIDRSIKSQLQRFTALEPLEVEEILTQAEGWGIARIEVQEGCTLVGKQLHESRPRDLGILIIAIERGDQYIPSPGRNDTIYIGDRLLVYGPLKVMEQIAAMRHDSAGDAGAKQA